MRIYTHLFAEIMQLVKESLELTWSKYLSNDWLAGNKSRAVSFLVDKYYVDVE